MTSNNLKEIILAGNNDYELCSNTAGTILYQEHFRHHVLTKTDLKEILRTISTGNFKAYLIKVNNGNILPPDDFSWIEKFNLIRLYNAGISYVAYVSPQNMFNSLEMEKELKPGKIFRIRIFKKDADAINWLEQKLNKDPEIFTV